MKSRSFLARFADAMRGFASAWRLHASVRRHVPPTIIAIVAGVWFRVSLIEWSLLAIAIGLVFTAEFMNSAIEHTARAMTHEHRDELRYALDIAAAGVAVAALTAIMIGACVFGPHVWTMIRSFRN